MFYLHLLSLGFQHTKSQPWDRMALAAFLSHPVLVPLPWQVLPPGPTEEKGRLNTRLLISTHLNQSQVQISGDK